MVVTGLGVVTSCGIGVEAFWAGLVSKPPVGRARPVRDLDVSHLFGPKSSVVRTALSSWPQRLQTRRSATQAGSRP